MLLEYAQAQHGTSQLFADELGTLCGALMDALLPALVADMAVGGGYSRGAAAHGGGSISLVVMQQQQACLPGDCLASAGGLMHAVFRPMLKVACK